MRRSIAEFVGLVLFGAVLCSIANAQKNDVELIVPTGHSDEVRSVSMSADGRTLASGSLDNMINLWDIETGRLLRTLIGHASHVWSVSFSLDGKVLASGSFDNTVKLWDVETGKELMTLKGNSGSISATSFDPDGKILAAGAGQTVKLWDTKSGNELRTLTGHTNAITSMAFSFDGMVLATGSFGAIKLWDVETGEELRTLDGHSDYINSVSFSSDAKMLASGGGKTVKIWNLESGSEMHTLTGHSQDVSSVWFPRDGTTLASTGGELKIWNLESGKDLRTIKTYGGSTHSVARSEDETILASPVGRVVNVWRAESGELIRTLEGISSKVGTVSVSPDSSELTTQIAGDSIKIWDLNGEKEVKTLTGQPYSAETIAMSSDGKTIASGAQGIGIKIWDKHSGKEMSLIPFDGAIWSISFSPDGQLLAGATSDYPQRDPDAIVHVWDVKSGRKLRSIIMNDYIAEIAISSDGKILASSGRMDTIVTLTELESGKELGVLSGHSSPVESIAFSSNGNLIATGSRDTTIKLWDVAGGNELRTLKGHLNLVNSVSFASDGKTLASGSSDGSTKIWDVNSAEELCSLVAFGNSDWLVTTPDGFFDGTPNAWKQLIWRFDGNTFNHAPVEAFYNEFFRPGLLQGIMSRRMPDPPKNDPSSIDIRQPEIKIAVIDENRIEESTVATSKREVRISVEVTDNNKKGRRPEHKPSSGARDLRLFRSGSLVKYWSGDVFAKESGCEVRQLATNGTRKAICNTTVTITAGNNELSAYAFNSQNVKSDDSIVSIEGAESLRRRGKLLVLAVGVNKYANKDRNLKYAVPDAVDFAAELRKCQIDLKNFETPEVIQLTDGQATKKNILLVLDSLAAGGQTRSSNRGSGELAKRLEFIEKAQPEDLVVIYFAGHGMASKDRFFLIPHDGFPTAKLNDDERSAYLRRNSISDLELENAFRDVDAGQIMLVIDACNSGQALESEEKRRGPMNSKGLAQLAYEKGMNVLTASQSFQAALEVTRTAQGKKIEHGLLTFSLLEGLTDRAADTNSDKQIIDREWFNYAVARVPTLQLDSMKARNLDNKNEKDTAKKRAELVFVNGDDKNLPPEKRGLQTPRVFYRRESSTVPFIVSRP